MNMNGKKLARLKVGMRQQDLATKVNISPALISRFELEDARPSPELARKINCVLGERVYSEEA